MKKYSFITLLALSFSNFIMAQPTQLKVATFNVSMEALNYVSHKRGEMPDVSGQTLKAALKSGHQQIKNIAEIIQRGNPDIILLNEFDNEDNSHDNKHEAINYFIKEYLNKSQNGQGAIDFPYIYQGPSNTGINSGFDIDGNGTAGQLPGDGYGFGYFPGHFAMVLLSKYPINHEDIRTFQHFKLKDMPNALKPIDPSTGKDWYSDKAWQSLRLSSKSHWDIPVNLKGKEIHILASHPTPPVFDGPENRHGMRNHDEIRFWVDYISPNQSSYIYDDQGKIGGLKQGQPFVILGDLNASSVDGDAITTGITSLLNDKNIQDTMPQSQGAKVHTPNNINAQHHTAFWRMRADYVLPSVNGFKVKSSDVFWPLKTDDTYRLIKDRNASSDHRMVWLELILNN